MILNDVMASNPVKELARGNKTKPVKTLEYKIFLYRQELTKSKSDYMKSSKVKLHLTNSLIKHNINNINKCNVSEVVNINAQLDYRKRLCVQRYNFRKLEQMGLINVSPKYIWDEI